VPANPAHEFRWRIGLRWRSPDDLPLIRCRLNPDIKAIWLGINITFQIENDVDRTTILCRSLPPPDFALVLDQSGDVLISLGFNPLRGLIYI